MNRDNIPLIVEMNRKMCTLEKELENLETLPPNAYALSDTLRCADCTPEVLAAITDILARHIRGSLDDLAADLEAI